MLAFYQDLKFRAISWLVFPGLLICSVGIFISADMRLLTIFMNLTFLTLVLGTLFVYISIKRGEITNIFKADFGWGDVLFLIAITPLFLDRNFILFFISGMLLSGFIHLILIQFKANPKIPLAGYLAVYLTGLIVMDYCFDFQLFKTNLI